MADGNTGGVPRITLLSGLLGSGKTTLIKRMFREGYLGGHPVLLENDFGSLGVDGPLMQSMGLQVTELVSGCICCSLSGAFPAELAKLLESPGCEQLVIEPSGVGKLSDVIGAICQTDAEWDPGLTVCTVDAELFHCNDEDFTECFWDQILNADAVALTFADEVDDGELLQVIDAIYAKDPGKIVISPADDDNLAGLLSKIAPRALARAKEEAALPGDAGLQDGGEARTLHHHGDANPYDSYAKAMEPGCSMADVLAAVQQLSDSARFGTVLRAKGLVDCKGGLVNANYVPGRAQAALLPGSDSARIEGQVESGIVVIGIGLDRDALDELFSF